MNTLEEFESRDINLLTCFNSTYAKYILIAIDSYLQNSSLNLHPTFAIDNSVNQEQVKIISSVFPNSNFIRIDSNSVVNDFPTFLKFSKLHISAMYRIYAIQHLKERLTLYVDADTICRGSLKGLYKYVNSIDLNEKIVAACSHFRQGDAYKICELHSPYLYFNSGVLLFNAKEFSKIINPKMIQDVVIKKPQMLDYADQSPMNYLLKGNVKWMEYIYNAETWHFIENIPFYKAEVNPLAELLDFSIERAINEAIIIHFTGIKPWDLVKSGLQYEHEPRNIQFWINAKNQFIDKYGNDPLLDIEKHETITFF